MQSPQPSDKDINPVLALVVVLIAFLIGGTLDTWGL